MNFMTALGAVAVIAAVGALGAQASAMRSLIGIFVPYAAITAFILGMIVRVARWVSSPVPFRITATCGQQKSLPWIRAGWLESPYTRLGTAARIALEVLLFRSLFRNTRADLRPGPRLVYGEAKWLWLGALAFHWSLLVVFLRHLRFFVEPVPNWVLALATLDGFFQVGSPELMLTDVFLGASLAYLLYRRLGNPQVRYISLFTDYFALLLLMGIAASGIMMRYFIRVDLPAVKQFAMGMATFAPATPPAAGWLFYTHLLMLCTLIAYFPFSKLMHMAGIFLSPTRNLANTNRMVRHINPWNHPVKVHTYEEWEHEFHEKIKAAGLPLERES